MKPILFILVSLSLALTLSACAYKPLKAPCAPDEGGTPLAYADLPPAPLPGFPIHAINSCGPMRPI